MSNPTNIQADQLAPAAGMSTTASVAVAAVASAGALLAKEAQAAVTIGSNTKPLNYHDAWRFLTQATFGPTADDLKPTSLLMQRGYVAWLNDQFARIPKRSTFDLTVDKNNGWLLDDGQWMYLGRVNDGNKDQGMVAAAVWEQFLSGEDQLRQRVAFALSEILVVSLLGGDLGQSVLKVAAYHDLLVKNAFGSFRTLIEGVCRSPAMGAYLTFLRNEKPKWDTSVTPPKETQIPDQNYARELMQLFTIGLEMLNMDGTPVLDEDGKAKPTYSPHDIAVLSYVFTGWSHWSNGEGSFIGTFNDAGFDNLGEIGNFNEASWEFMRKPMMAYDETNPHFTEGTFGPHVQRHAQPDDFQNKFRTKSPLFLGKALQSTGTCEGDMRNALNILLSHQNVAPFMAKQMIQRLVTSNPSPAYVRRVAQQFKSSNLSLRVLVSAILLDTEARDVYTARRSPTYGKLREPVLCVTAILRGLKHGTHLHPDTGKPLYNIPLSYFTTSSYSCSLGQGPYQAASVFNFFRPGYKAPGSESAKKNMVVPELQAMSPVEVTAYVNTIANMLNSGGFGNGAGPGVSRLFWYGPVGSTSPAEEAHTNFCIANREALTNGVEIDYNHELNRLVGTGAENVEAYITDLSNRFLGGQISISLSEQLTSIFQAYRNPSPKPGDYFSTKDRQFIAITAALLVLFISPQFVVQK